MHTVRTPLRALAATTLAVGIALGASPARAAGPTHSVESLDFTLAAHGPMTQACGFPVSLHVYGSFNLVTWTDAEGNPTKEIRNFRFRSDISANGVTLHGLAMGPETATFHPDGSFTVEAHGIVNRRVKGMGTVTLFSGLTITDIDGETEVELFRSGPDDEDVSELCAAFTD
ncbi:hypothetical protein [Knoellia aerolata]|uniref:Uncharacterized protein n=1 Tax=Knoellia aerolata DSM 18566 TaxID=1385519 RepID=A0A0A0K202_9MICO|nr:hypothetical protein [Knoellia aerolata]KGN41826.1 hypothetical protein N801_04670 [Knoellia aerolata DSM 18566]